MKPAQARIKPGKPADVHADYLAAVAQLKPEHRAALAAALKLLVSALDVLPVGWTGKGWAMPESDAQGNIIGLNVRYPDGSKKVMPGHKRGLTLPTGWQSLPDPVLCVEGASDVLAGRLLGLNVIGRPSNAGGAELLAVALKGRKVIVLGENDRKPDGTWPGRDGAETIARKLAADWNCSIEIAFPPEGAKDLRAWALAQGDLSDPAIAKAAGDAFFLSIALDTETITPPPPPVMPTARADGFFYLTDAKTLYPDLPAETWAGMPEKWQHPLTDKSWVLSLDPNEAGKPYCNYGRIESVNPDGTYAVAWFRKRDGETIADLTRPADGEATRPQGFFIPVREDTTWHEIEPLDAEPELPALDLQACIPDALAPVREFIEAVSVSLQVPQDLPAMLALSAASLAVCGAYELRILPDWQETPPVWICTLAEPGERKSAVFGIITRPITEWQKNQAAKLSRDISEQREARMLDERLLDKLRGIGGNPDKDLADRTSARQEALNLAAKLADEPTLHAPQLLASDATPEAVAEMLADNGERLGLFAAEGDAVDVLLGRYSNRPNMGIYLSAWGGEAYTVNRRGREPLHLSRPTLVFGLCIQPQAIAAMLADPDARGRGFIPRFMFSRPASRLGSRVIEPPPIPEHLAQDWQGRITRLLDLERPGDVVKDGDKYTRRGGNPVIVTLSPGAAGRFRGFRVACEPELRPDGGELAGVNGWGSKLPGAIARIALSLHALSGNPEPTIPEAIMQAAIGWADYLIQHYKAVAGPLKTDPNVQQARRLLDWIRREHIARFVFGDMQALRTVNYPDLEKWQPVYRVLCERGYLRHDRKESGPKGGRPTDAWIVNPAFLKVKGRTSHTKHTNPPCRGKQD